ncbi:hypothetical protein CVT25_005481 [Psilocybe cyanescens]|uniref:Uncharacterized protein n=1 Tax=Psilocybe cyanescens TaxID=93625 RepID=A0A409XSC3_PSICY|nr:hypothetical protein CVT25_005481 [Psilocybe cyanescens]
MSILQAYQYFLNYKRDSLLRKLTVLAVFIQGTFLYILGGSHTICSYKLITYDELAALSGGTGVATARGDDSCMYANSILAIFNAKSRLKKKVEASAEFHLSRSIMFGDVGNNSDTPNG